MGICSPGLAFSYPLLANFYPFLTFFDQGKRGIGVIRGDKSKGDLGARGWQDVFLAGSSTAGSVFLPVPTLIHCCTIILPDGIIL